MQLQRFQNRKNTYRTCAHLGNRAETHGKRTKKQVKKNPRKNQFQEFRSRTPRQIRKYAF